MLHTSPPPKQNPVTPTDPLDCPFRNAMVALWSEFFSSVVRFASAALYAAWSVSFAAPPSRAARSMLTPMKPAVAERAAPTRKPIAVPQPSLS